jgi:ABC-type transporter Mla subunit MlaD
MEPQQTVLVIMAVFTGVAAAALLLQMVFLFGIYRSVKTLKHRSMIFLDRWEPVADESLKTITGLREQSREVLEKVSNLTDATKLQVEKIESILTDFSSFSKTQLNRVDETVASTLDRVTEATDAMQQTLLAPVHQIRAIATALGAIVGSLFGGRRQSVDRATIDEEMFI